MAGKTNLAIIRNLVQGLPNRKSHEWESSEHEEIEKSSEEDIISVSDLAHMLGKSPSWCYGHAAELGASKVGGSIIFRRSTLKEALDNARMVPRKPKEEAPILVTKQKKGRRHDHHVNTDPAAHGLWNFTLLARKTYSAN